MHTVMPSRAKRRASAAPRLSPAPMMSAVRGAVSEAMRVFTGGCLLAIRCGHTYRSSTAADLQIGNSTNPGATAAATQNSDGAAMNRTSKKVAVIAGDGEGLGQAIARRFAPDY